MVEYKPQGLLETSRFEHAFAKYFAGCVRIHREALGEKFFELCADRGKWRVDKGNKRLRVVCANSVHSFVDLASGDVLMAAGWKAPAKHARGNIYDDRNGLGNIGPYGPAYLK